MLEKHILEISQVMSFASNLIRSNQRLALAFFDDILAVVGIEISEISVGDPGAISI